MVSFSQSYTIVIPTYNDGQIAVDCILNIQKVLNTNSIESKIIVVDDSNPENFELLLRLPENNIKIIKGDRNGFGSAIVKGIQNANSDNIIVMMGDQSENPNDLVKIVAEMENGYQLVFGDRFSNHSQVKNYPKLKYWLNRAMNFSLKVIFRINSKDITNAFTGYSLSLLNSLQIESTGFELSIELPLKLINHLGATYTSVDVSWFNRIDGVSKMNLLKVGYNYWKLIFKMLK